VVIAQPAQPLRKHLGLTDFDQFRLYPIGYTRVKAQTV
jgi:hypothetical protein